MDSAVSWGNSPASEWKSRERADCRQLHDYTIVFHTQPWFAPIGYSLVRQNQIQRKQPMKNRAKLPQRRKKGLLIEQLPTETVVYDTTNQKAHCLNRIAALVWQHSDGRTSEEELAAILTKELELPSDELLIQLTLEKLAKAGLLEEEYVLPASISRRQAGKSLAKFGIAAAGALVATIVAPTAAQAATAIPCANNQGCATNNCCKNTAGSPGNTPGCGTCFPKGAHCPNGNC